VTALAHDALVAAVRARFAAVEPRTGDNGRPWLLVAANDLPAVCRFVRDEPALAFDSLMDLTGYDLLKYPSTPPSTAIAVVYLLHSLQHRHKLTLQVLAPRDDCRVPTASGVWPAALYFEREVWDLLGVQFEGHPSLHRIMTPDDWTGHPLRKDYLYPADYHGIPHLRDGQHFEHRPLREGQPAPAKPAAPGGHA
jgi:NADH-quinone oxidoreductase subunit C